MINVLFVCMGNICRSPLAQGIFEKKVKELGLNEKIYIDSAGTIGYHAGSRPDAGSIKAAHENGIDITWQRSRRVEFSDREEFHYLIAMDRSNAASLLGEYAIPEEKVIMIRDFDPEGRGDIPDPYGGRQNAFDLVYDMLDRSMTGFIEFLKEKHPELNN